MDSDSSHSNDSDSDDYQVPYLFKSALDVGSLFVDIVPDNELVFIKKQEAFLSQLTIRNVNTRSPVAFFVRIIVIVIYIGIYICSISNPN
jgi:hypothetical protein